MSEGAVWDLRQTRSRVILALLAWQEAPYRTCIMEPLGKMNSYFPVINEHISKRNKKVRFSAVRMTSVY